LLKHGAAIAGFTAVGTSLSSTFGSISSDVNVTVATPGA
jgi:Flp pilus assembly pilin Flp